MKRGRKKQFRSGDPVSKVAPKQVEPLGIPAFRWWQTGGLILALGVIAIGALAWKCDRDPKLNFFPSQSGADWIIFPRAMDSTAHRVANLDTTFRRQVTLNDKPRTAKLEIRAAKKAELKINDVPVDLAAPPNWKDAASVDVSGLMMPGNNTISIRVINNDAPAALWCVLTAGRTTVQSDNSWEASCADSTWRRAVPVTPPIMPGPGNAMAGEETTISAVHHVWVAWLIFAGMAAAICVAGFRWCPQILDQVPGGFFTSRQIKILLVTVAILWLLLFLNNARLMPFLLGFDSREHADYITYVQERHALPLPTDGFEMFQPPLYYVISAILLSCFGLTVESHAGIVVLRILTLLCGLAQFVFVFLSVRLLFRDRPMTQLVSLLLAAFLPMNIYMSHYVTNETLSAALVTVSLYLGLRLLRATNPSTGQFAWLGFVLGAAMLAKATALLVVLPIFAVMAGMLLVRRASVSAWLRQFGTLLVVFLIVCGWHHVRIWYHFGTPLLGNWDPAAGFGWWQDPGYHAAVDYLRFGKSLVAPLFSGFATFADGIYSTLWGDGLIGGVPSLSYRPPWNYDLMIAGYLLALVPTSVILVGVAVAFWRLLQKPSAEWIILLGFTGMVILGVIFMTLKVASYAQVKAFYGLAVLVPFCSFGAVGWETLTRGRRIWQGVLALLLLLWALNSFVAFWGMPSSTQHVYVSRRLSAEGKPQEATREAARAVEIDPANPEARRVLAFMLSESGRANEAVPEARRAVELDPKDDNNHLQLGIALDKQDQTDSAIEEVRRAIELGPENLSAYAFLPSFLSKKGRTDEAIEVSRESLGLYPYDAGLHYNLSVILARKPDYLTACRHLVYALLLWPDFPQAKANFRITLGHVAAGPDGIKEVQAIVSAAGDEPVILDEAAWFFATQPNAAFRDGKEAVRLAEQASLLAKRAPRVLTALAAAYAETARFQEAIKTAEEARLGAQTVGDGETVTLTEKLLSQFRKGQAYRDGTNRK